MKHAHVIRQPGTVVDVTTIGDPAVGGVDRALDRLRVAITADKRMVGRLVLQAVPDCHDGSLLAVVRAVEQGPASDHDEVTVGLVAGRLGVDPSHASRLVATAIRSGLLRRVASQEDGRRSHLELTDVGQHVADRGHEVRRSLVTRAMADWDEAERAHFARLFERFADGLAAAVAEAGVCCPEGARPAPGGSAPGGSAPGGSAPGENSACP